MCIFEWVCVGFYWCILEKRAVYIYIFLLCYTYIKWGDFVSNMCCCAHTTKTRTAKNQEETRTKMCVLWCDIRIVWRAIKYMPLLSRSVDGKNSVKVSIICSSCADKEYGLLNMFLVFISAFAVCDVFFCIVWKVSMFFFYRYIYLFRFHVALAVYFLQFKYLKHTHT